VADGPRALLITGPGGSGKSTLARNVADRLGWACLSEDEHWVANGWGSGLRSPEHERIVQDQVARDLLEAIRSGRGVALEFILYQVPPNPLTAYQDVLAANGIASDTVVLKPPVDEILRRMAQRGRPSDADLEGRRPDAEWQIAILEAGGIAPAWVVDPTGLTAEETLARALARLGLTTERLCLEPITTDHAEAMFEVLGAPEIYAYLDESPPDSVDALRERYRVLERRTSPDGTEQWLNWAVRRAEDGHHLGYVQATVRADGWASVAYVLSPGTWGHGYATEAVTALAAWLETAWGVTTLDATVDRRNHRSIALLERLGFAPTGRTPGDDQHYQR